MAGEASLGQPSRGLQPAPLDDEADHDGCRHAVILDPVKAQVLASAGEFHWGGAASTVFWIDPKEDLFTVFLTQLRPSSTYPLRRELRVRIYQTLVD